MERLEQIKIDYNRGRMSFKDLDWLIDQVALQTVLAESYQAMLKRANNRIEELTKDGK